MTRARGTGRRGTRGPWPEERHDAPLAYIAEDLRDLAVDVTTVNPAPNNARQHDLEKDIPILRQSLRSYGQRKPIVGKRSYRGVTNAILAGNGTLLAARAEGWTHVAVSWVPDGWSDEQAQEFALVDNRSAELSQWNLEELASQLRELKERGGDAAVEAAGWSVHESAPLLAAQWRPAEEAVLHPNQAGRESSWRKVTLSVGQWQVVEMAIRRLHHNLGDDTIPEGRALELICADYLGGPAAQTEG